MKKYDDLYLDNESVLEEYNNLIRYINENYDCITCVDYNRTLVSILINKTYDKQLKETIEQQREGRNSIDTFEHYIEDNNDDKDIINKIKKDYDCESFQTELINTVFSYYETSVEENNCDEEE